jgi:hypothetical protein
MQRADPEVEAVEDHVHGDHDRQEDVPERLHDHVGPRATIRRISTTYRIPINV